MLIQIDSPEALDSLPAEGSALPAGTRLGEFELRGVLGEGGFGIVYQAFDHSLQRDVAIKEYLPQALAQRGVEHEAVLRDEAHAADFALGLESFVNEARTLAQFDHPALLKVYRFWQANGTAYMAMPLYRGQTLHAWRLGLGRAPAEAEVRPVMEALLAALQVLHSHKVLHGDVAPDNILIDDAGHPVLLDFGAARQVLRATPNADVAMIKPAYSALEQHGVEAAGVQGPWSDLYSLGASLYFMLMGAPPPRATARAAHDTLRPLPARVLNECSSAFLQSVDGLLALRSADRPRSAGVVLAAVQALPWHGERAAAAAPLSPVTEIFEWAPTQCEALAPAPSNAGANKRGVGRVGWLAALAAGVVLAVIGAVTLRAGPAVPTPPAPQAAASASTAAVPSPPAAVVEPATVPAAAPASLAASGVAQPPNAANVPAAPAANAKLGAVGPRATPAPAAAPKAIGKGVSAGTPELAASALAPPASPAAPAPAVASPVAPAPATPLAPREQCGGQLPLLRDVCLQRQCGKSEWRSHPHCVELQQLQESYRQRGDG